MEFVKDQNNHRPPWEINTHNNTETLLLWLSFFTYLYTLTSLVVRLKVPYSIGNYSLSLNYTTTDQLEMTKKDFVPIFFAEDCVNIQRYKVKNETTPKTFDIKIDLFKGTFLHWVLTYFSLEVLILHSQCMFIHLFFYLDIIYRCEKPIQKI